MVNKNDAKIEFTKRLRAACLDAGVAGRGLGKRIADALLSQKIKISTPAVWKWLNAESIPDSGNILALSRWLNVRPEWLEYGRGEMREAKVKPRDGVPMSEFVEIPIITWDSSDPLDNDEVEIPFYKSIELAAGNGCCVNEDYNGFKLRFSKATLRRYGAEAKYTAAFPVSGDSMAPVIPNGSTVTIDRNHTKIVDGGIYVIEQDELFRVKLLYRQPGGRLIIRSYNSSEFPDEEAGIDTVKIIGRVINWSVMAW